MTSYKCLLLPLLFGASIANSASFDCAKAGTPFEKTICANPNLSSLDDKLAQMYFSAKATAANPEQFKLDQINWIKEARACGTDVLCIELAYRKRMLALTPRPVTDSSPPQKSAMPPTQQTQQSSAAASPQKNSSEVKEPQISEIDKNIGGCSAVVNWLENKNKQVSTEMRAIRNKYQSRVDSVMSKAETCKNNQGGLNPDCVKKTLSPQDYSLLLGFMNAVGAVRAPQDPNKLPNYELVTFAYCGPLMK